MVASGKLVSVAFVSQAFGAYTTSLDFASIAQCEASWSTYESISSAAVTNLPTTTIELDPVTTDLTYGTGSVYTTSDGIPVASGDFTPTKVVQTIYTVTSFDSFYAPVTRAITQALPTCSLLSPSDCSQLYVSYLQSLGLSEGASVPSITPPPPNSPPCPVYYYQPFSTCDYFTFDMGNCFLFGNHVEVFYFPYKTAPASGETSNPRVIQSYAPGITFTSPSIYLSFDFLTATSTYPDISNLCTSCGPDGCTTYGLGGIDSIDPRGTRVNGRILTLAPEDVSTLIVSFPPEQTSSIINVIAKGLPQFADYADQINFMNDFLPKRLNLDHFTHPPPEDYYLRPEGAPGCDGSVPSPMCSTIFEGMHRPILSLPSQVSLLQNEWATCRPAIYGVYDPPKALTEETTIEGVPGFTVPATPSTALTTPRDPTAVPQYTITAAPSPSVTAPGGQQTVEPDLFSGAPSPSATAPRSQIELWQYLVIAASALAATAPRYQTEAQEDPISGSQSQTAIGPGDPAAPFVTVATLRTSISVGGNGGLPTGLPYISPGSTEGTYTSQLGADDATSSDGNDATPSNLISSQTIQSSGTLTPTNMGQSLAPTILGDPIAALMIATIGLMILL